MTRGSSGRSSGSVGANYLEANEGLTAKRPQAPHADREEGSKGSPLVGFGYWTTGEVFGALKQSDWH